MSLEAGEIIYALGLNRTAFDAQLAGAESSLMGLGNSASSSFRTLSAGMLTLGFAEIVKKSLDAQQAITRTAVLLADNGKSQKQNIADMGSEVDKISNMTGLAATKIAAGLYMAKSALGDIGLANQAAEVSSKIAASSGADFSATIKTITGATNAYQAYGMTVAQVGDLIEKATQQGNFTWNDLNKALPNVTSWAADTGIGLKDLLATIDTIAKAGLPMANSVTGIRYLIAQFSRSKSTEAKELAKATGGASFDELIKKGMKLGDVIEIVQKHAKTMNTSLGDIFGVRGGAAAAAFEAQKPGTYESFLKALDNSKGLVDKQLNLTDNPARQMAIAFADVQAAVRKVVMEFAPLINAVTYAVGQTARFVSTIEGIVPALSLILGRWLVIKGLTKFTATSVEQIAVKKALVLQLTQAEEAAVITLAETTKTRLATEEALLETKWHLATNDKLILENEIAINAESKASDALLTIKATKEAVINKVVLSTAAATAKTTLELKVQNALLSVEAEKAGVINKLAISTAAANVESAGALGVQSAESGLVAANMSKAAFSSGALRMSLGGAGSGMLSQLMLFTKMWTYYQGFKALTDTKRNTGIATDLYGGGLKSIGAGVQLNIMDFANRETGQKIPFFNNYMKTMTSIPTASVGVPFSASNPNTNDNRQLGDAGTQTTDPNAPGYVDPNARATEQLKTLDSIFKADSNYVDLLSAKKNAINGVTQAQKTLTDAEVALSAARSHYQPNSKFIFDANYAVGQAKLALTDAKAKTGIFNPASILKNAKEQSSVALGRNAGITALNAAHATNAEILYLLQIDQNNPGVLANLAKNGVAKPWLKALDASLQQTQDSNSALTDYIKSITPAVLQAAGDLGSEVGKMITKNMWMDVLTSNVRLMGFDAKGHRHLGPIVRHIPLTGDPIVPKKILNSSKPSGGDVLTFLGNITINANNPKEFGKMMKDHTRALTGVD